MTIPATLGDAFERVRTIEGMMKIFSKLLDPVYSRELGKELDMDDPPLLTDRVVVPESAWAAVKVEIEARIRSLEAEKAAMEVMPMPAFVLPEFLGLGEVVAPVAPPAKERRRRVRHALRPVPAEPAAGPDQAAA